MRLLAGTSGFNFDAWRGYFYPEDIGSNEMLAFYAARLPVVEINYTFYRTPSLEILERWTAETPETFRFAVKASQRITHRARLKEEAVESTAFFAERIRHLGAKLGPVLFQLPPNLKKDAPRLAAFLARLPAGLRSAFEFRNTSWFDDETFDQLRGAGAALCIAEDEKLAAPLVRTAPFGYLRLRRPDYDAAALDSWADRIRGAGWDDDVYVFFKHEDEAKGTSLAKELTSRIMPTAP